MGGDGAGGAEERLLLAALAWAGGHGPDLAGPVRAVRRWPRALRIAAHRGCLETLAYAVAASGAEGALPAGLAAQLRAAQELGTARNLVLLSEAARLQEKLAAAGLPSVALKGTALLAAHYPLPGARHAADLDLLVPAERLAEASAALAGEGPALPPAVDLRGADAAAAEHHLWPFHTAGGVACELHFRLPGLTRPEDAARILATARTVPAGGGRGLRIPLPADCGAIAATHALGHHGAAPARYLPRLIADLEALDATGGLDWEAVGRAAGREGEGAVRRARALLAAARAGQAAAVFPGRASMLPGELRQLARSLGLHAFFPSRRFMAWRYGVPERSPRLLLYYLARPVLAVRDRLRG